MSIIRRISVKEVLTAARIIWADKSTADKIAENAIEIINWTQKRKITFYNGKCSKGLIGGLFYLLGYKFDSVQRQRELAKRLGTTEVTIRASFRQWLLEFPDLFLDVIAKFAADKDLKYFVLVDLNQKLNRKVTRG